MVLRLRVVVREHELPLRTSCDRPALLVDRVAERQHLRTGRIEVETIDDVGHALRRFPELARKEIGVAEEPDVLPGQIDERGRIDLSLKALEEPPALPVQRAPRFMPAASTAPSVSGNSDDFEKKLSSFMKLSEEKNSMLMNAKNGKSGRPPRRKGARP